MGPATDGYPRGMGETVSSEGESPRDEQSETVHAPHEDPAPPQRTMQTVVWVVVGIAALIVLAVLLIIAAVRAG
jgi:hypothetical protein